MVTPRAWFGYAVTIVACGVGGCRSLGVDPTETLALSTAIAQVKLFAGLTAAEQNELRGVARLRRGYAGEYIIEQGKRASKMFIILEGEAEVRVNGKPVAVLAEQPLVGEMEFIEGLPASADVLLLSVSELLELDNDALNGLMERQPRIGYVLMRELARIESQRLRQMNIRQADSSK